jgi:glycosyltransferase involved in cell wall biosynthesis
MAALHADEEWFCRAAWRHVAMSPRPPDIVHAHALPQMARLRVGTTPMVVFVPGPPHSRYFEDLRRADAVLGDGWAAAQLPAVLGRDVDPVPEAVDVDLFHPAGESRRQDLALGDKRVVLSVGRLVPIKNVRLLIDAMRIVVDADPSGTARSDRRWSSGSDRSAFATR